jgi:hypothetical protein
VACRLEVMRVSPWPVPTTNGRRLGLVDTLTLSVPWAIRADPTTRLGADLRGHTPRLTGVRNAIGPIGSSRGSS